MDFNDLSDLEDDSNDDLSGDEFGQHSDSEEEEEVAVQAEDNYGSVIVGKDGTEWYTIPPLIRQTPQHQLLRQQQGLPLPARNNQTAEAAFFKLFSIDML